MDQATKVGELNSASSLHASICLWFILFAVVISFLQFLYYLSAAVLNAQNLSSELATVVDWFGLGLNLGLPKHELDRIERDYQGNDR